MGKEVRCKQLTVNSRQSTVNRKLLTALILSSILLISFVAVTIATGFFGTNTTKISSLEKGLIGHWMLDVENGAKDLTPYGNHGNVIGASLTTGVKDEPNRAYNFASTNRIEMTGISLSKDASFCAWGNANTAGTNMMLFSCNSNSITGPDFYFTASTIAWNSGDSASTPFKKNGVNVAQPTLNEWHHYCIISKSDLPKTYLYVDGEYYGEANYKSPAQTNRGFIIGNYYPGQTGYAWRGKIADFRIYNRQLSEDEIQLLYDSHKPTASASDLNKGLILYSPLNGENGIDFTINEYSYPTFNTSSSNGGWSHWGQSGASGSHSQNTNKDYIFDKTNTYSHKVSNGLGATGNYILYQSPPIEGLTYRSLSAIIKLSDGSQITNSKVYPAWNAIASGSIPNNKWTSIEYLGDGFYLCKAEGIRQDGSNDLVGIYVTQGIEAYFSNVQLEQKIYSSSFVNGGRNGTVDDRSGYSNKGINFGATLTNGRKGESKGAYVFDGTDDYIEFYNNNLFNSLPVTFSLWYYHDSTHGGDLINKYYSNSVNGYSIALSSSTGGIRLYYFKSGSNYIENYNSYHGQSILDSWNHVSISVDENNAKIYLNGELIATKNWVGVAGKPTTNQNLALGYYPGATSSYSNNIISDVRIYNRVLSEDEIKLLFDSYKPKETSTGSLNKGLVFDMPLTTRHMKSSTIVSDLTPYGNDGTVMNGAVVSEDGTTFDGVNDYIEISNNNLLNFEAKNFTISFWTYRTSEGYQGGSYISKGTHNSAGFDMYDSRFEVRAESGLVARVKMSANFNVWEMHTMVVNQQSSPYIKHYINDILDQTGYTESGNKGSISNLRNLIIGRSNAGGINRYFNGQISNVKIWDRALTDDEIKLLYDKGR